jgi:hypothetical protein
MKLKSETKQVIIFLENRVSTLCQNKTVLERCKFLQLNYDMVCRALQQLHVKQVIGRDSRGPLSAYQYPAQIGLGDIIDAVQGICLETHSDSVKQALNNVKL